jgi:hypothetical protein
MMMLLPTRWSDQYRHTSLSIAGEGRDAVFNGKSLALFIFGLAHSAAGPLGSSESQASAVRTSVPVPPACGIYYYEVEIVNKGAKG